ncbi:Uma2 family endonuclease [Actinacidiphila glaucinigra]|uniref:Uma2 family endonuclease n=1 Tax=Actinacidiphila glaucinigra TaxID=235986 RepID=UPI003D9176DD
MTAEPLPAWAIPPRGGFTSDDLDRIPDLPPHTELIDGSLVFVSPQKSFHSPAMYLLEQGLRATAPETLRVRREMSLVLNTRNRPEPDLVLVRARRPRATRPTRPGYQAADAVLVVEVVSPDSEERDRKRKPQLYAEAGIPHFWRVEKGGEGRLPVVYVFEREPATGAYIATGIHHDRLKVSVPFAVDIDLSGIDRL